jgi:hypothetical protein
MDVTAVQIGREEARDMTALRAVNRAALTPASHIGLPCPLPPAELFFLAPPLGGSEPGLTGTVAHHRSFGSDGPAAERTEP